MPATPDVPWPCSRRPAGSEPLLTAQLIGGVPPLVVMVWLYAVPALPLGRVVVVILNGGLMVMLKAWFTLCGGVPESFAVTVNFAVPAVVGVPEIAPELFKFNPAGKLPVVTVQVTVPVPPELCREAL